MRTPIIVLASLLAFVPSASAQLTQGLGDLFGPRREEPLVDVSGSAWLYETVDVRNRSARFSERHYDLDVSLPLFSDERRTWSMGIDYSTIDVSTSARMPFEPLERFPSTFTDVGLSTSFTSRLDNDWTVGVSTRVGSASDKPFRTLDEYNVDVNAFVSIPHKKRNAWVVMANYANRRNNGGLNHVPLIGGGYRMALEGENWLLLGAPFMAAHYKPADWLTLDLQYMLIRNVNARATWHVLDEVDLFAGFAWDSDAFWRSERADRDEAFMFYRKKLSGGVDWRLADNVTFGVEAGYSFGRFVYEGHDYDDHDNNRLSLDPGAFGGVSVVVEF